MLIVHFIVRRIRRLSSGESTRETRSESRTRGAFSGGLRFRTAAAGDLEQTEPTQE